MAAATEKPKVEEVVDSDESSSDSEPEVGESSGAGQEAGAHKINRNEKKSRKAFSKMGLKKVEGVVRVTMKKAKDGMLIVIQQPEVMRVGDTFVVFGEFSTDNLQEQMQRAAAKQLNNQAGGAAGAAGPSAVAAASSDSAAAPSANIIEDADADDSGDGLQASDIEMVMKQAKVDRPQAIAALRSKNGDLVDAIMALSTK